MRDTRKLSFRCARSNSGDRLAGHCIAFAVDYFIGVNFTGATANGAPTSLDAGDSAGVIPQTGWNNSQPTSGAKGILSDGAGNLTGITISYLTGEMFGSGTYNVGLGFTNGNDKLLNGYLNSTDPGSFREQTSSRLRICRRRAPTPSLLTHFGTLRALRPPIGSMKITRRPS